MKLKFLVLYHKDDFGSTIEYSGDLTEREKKILYSIDYKKEYEGNGDIKKVSKENHTVYFKNSLGGKDEFSRDYINTIAIIFPFTLSKKELEKLSNFFKEIESEIATKSFDSDQPYYLNLSHFSNTSIRVLLLISLTINLLFSGFQIYEKFFKTSSIKDVKNNWELQKENNNFVKNLQNTADPLKKFVIYQNYIQILSEKSSDIISQIEKKDYEEIIKFSKQTSLDEEKFLNMMNSFLDNEYYTHYKEEVKNLKNTYILKTKKQTYREFQSLIRNYNESLSFEDLITVENRAINLKANLDYRKSDINHILKQIDRIKKGINIEVEMYILEKSYVFNNKKIKLEMYINNNYITKNEIVLKNNGKIYLGSFYRSIALDDKLKAKFYLYDSNNKNNQIRELEFNIKDIKTPFIIKDKHENSLKFSLTSYGIEKFKINYK
ncbi:MAG: hypothetical protein ACQERZ_05220 [Fusobacteriota bacterium]